MWRRTVASAVGTLLAPLPLELWQRAFPKDSVAVCYHTVSDDDLPHLRLYRYKTREQFDADLRYIKPRALSYDDLRNARLGSDRSRPNRIFLTFDDGLVECYTTIRPMLLEHGIDAAFFVPTRFIDDADVFHESVTSLCIDAVVRADARQCAEVFDSLSPGHVLRDERRARARLRSLRLHTPPTEERRRLLAWILDLAPHETDLRTALCERLDVNPREYVRRQPIFMRSEQIRALAADGFTVGAHGIGHESLERRTQDQIVHEIFTSTSTIRAITGKERVPFAFPYSGLAVDRKLLARIREEHPFIDLFFDSGALRSEPSIVVNRVFSDDPMTTIPRVFSRAWAQPSAWYARA